MDVTAELRLARLARELAMGLEEPDKVLERLGLTREDWRRLERHPHFQQVLAVETAAWESALNTHERVKLKASAIMEDWLGEACARMHDRGEALPAKTEVAKLVTRLAGMGIDRAEVVGGGERFVLQINIGDGREHRIESVGRDSGPLIEGSVG